MRPMSLWESGHPTGEASLGSLLSGEIPQSEMTTTTTLEEIATRSRAPAALTVISTIGQTV